MHCCSSFEDQEPWTSVGGGSLKQFNDNLSWAQSQRRLRFI